MSNIQAVSLLHIVNTYGQLLFAIFDFFFTMTCHQVESK